MTIITVIRNLSRETKIESSRSEGKDEFEKRVHQHHHNYKNEKAQKSGQEEDKKNRIRGEFVGHKG